ncbi:MAG: hypothetical protein JO301_12550 [Chitinophagaceae bacterium]|nr:hypothetical protein [Chitinophagaceae bacterium]
MNKIPLLPHAFQRVGWILLVPFLALGIAYTGWEYQIPGLGDFSDELISVGNIVSLMLVAFSAEKVEDEAIQFFRLASLQWAVIVNYLILIVCIITVYGTNFLSVMIYNMFTILVIFILRFRILLYQHNKASV